MARDPLSALARDELRPVRSPQVPCICRTASDSILTPERLRSPPILIGANRLLQNVCFVSIVFVDPGPRTERERSVLSRRLEERLIAYRQVIQVAEDIL